jgi:hypothetical protein
MEAPIMGSPASSVTVPKIPWAFEAIDTISANNNNRYLLFFILLLIINYDDNRLCRFFVSTVQNYDNFPRVPSLKAEKVDKYRRPIYLSPSFSTTYKNRPP